MIFMEILYKISLLSGNSSKLIKRFFASLRFAQNDRWLMGAERGVRQQSCLTPLSICHTI